MPETMRKARFIYNPAAGHRRITANLEAISALYAENGYELELVVIGFAPEDEDRLVGELGNGYHHLLIAGGDGTINYVINLLKGRGVDIPLAMLPAGTANDFTSVLGMPRDPLTACRGILEGSIRNIDIGSVNGRYFVNVFSCGLFTDVSQKTPDFLKNTFGKIAYYFNGLADLPLFRRIKLKLEADDAVFDGNAIIFFVFNGRTAGKLPIAYLSEIDDGKLDVLIVKGNTPARLLPTAIQYIARHYRNEEYPPGVVHIRCSHLTAHSERNLNTDIDGQPGPGFPVEIKCHPGALRIILPEQPEQPAGRITSKSV